MLGSSWMTSIIGYLVMGLTVANQVFVEQGLPSDTASWIKFVGGIVTGVGIACAKDFNRSHSPAPVADAKVVNL